MQSISKTRQHVNSFLKVTDQRGHPFLFNHDLIDAAQSVPEAPHLTRLHFKRPLRLERGDPAEVPKRERLVVQQSLAEIESQLGGAS